MLRRPLAALAAIVFAGSAFAASTVYRNSNDGSGTTSRPYLDDGSGHQTPAQACLDASGAVISCAGPSNTPLPTAVAPVVTGAAASSLVLKASAGSLLSASVTASTLAGFMMIFDATTAPADGAVTPKLCVPVAASNFASATWPVPESYATGITVVFSTTGCFTKTASNAAFIRGQAQ